MGMGTYLSRFPRAVPFAGQLLVRTGDVTTGPPSLLRSQSVSCCSLKSHWQVSGHTLLLTDQKAESCVMATPAKRLMIIYWIILLSMASIHAPESTWTAKRYLLLWDSTFGTLSVLVLRDIFHG